MLNDKKTKDDLLKLIEKNSKTKDTSLYLSDFTGGELPSELWKLTHLTTLSLKNCSLEYIPPEIGSLINLKKLYLSDNHLKSFPIGICLLYKLEDLEINDNKLNHIPKEISNLINLKDLRLRGNELAFLPDEFSNLISLEDLNLNHNLFEKFPEVLCSLPNLDCLYLEDNLITSLPSSINNFENLTWLALSNNNLLYLSKEITYSLRRIDTVEFYDNPFTDMPEIKDKTIVEVFSYLESLNDNSVKVTYWEVPDALRTSLQQYLNYFSEFIFKLTSEELQFDVVKVENGLKLSTATTEKLSIHDINTYLSIYISQKTDITSPTKASSLKRFQTKEFLNEWQLEKTQLDFKLQMQADKIAFYREDIVDKNKIIEDLKVIIKFFQEQNSHLIKFLTNPDLDGKQRFLPQIVDKAPDNIQVTISNNSTANLILHSPSAKISFNITKQKEVIEQANRIIETVKDDEKLSETEKDQVIEVLAQLIIEANSGKTTQSNYEKLLGIGSNISSIGSLVISLLPFFSVKN